MIPNQYGFVHRITVTQAVVWHLEEKKKIKNLVGCVVLLLGWQMVPRQPDQQASTQCSLGPTEM